MNFLNKIKGRFFYITDSIKNRYPCKIIKIKKHASFEEEAIVTYQAVTRFNLRESTIDDILKDKMMVEKFHPTDCVKLGFLAASEIFFKERKSIDAIRNDYRRILKNMFDI